MIFASMLRHGTHNNRSVQYIPASQPVSDGIIPEHADLRNPRVFIPMAQDIINDEPAFCVRPTYLGKLLDRGLTPYLIIPTMDSSVIERAYAASAGVLFMGGSDINPDYYGAKRHAETKSTEPDRDKLELSILPRVLADRKPFLGICRGLQALVVGARGTLHQHVPDLTKENHMDTYHEMMVLSGSRAHKMIGKKHAEVNSYHHQAAKRIPKEFLVSGFSPDGIAELIEHKDDSYFCFGIQSHPEKERHSDLELFFDEFARQVRLTSKSQ